MKRKKKNIFLKLVITCILLTFITTTALSEEIIDLTTIYYLENDIIAINGDITLFFRNSTSGTNDINLLWRIYNIDNNITIYNIQSKTITYNSSFINDTKNYFFKDNLTNKTFNIKINYSNIQVPKSIEQILNETLIVKNDLILNLTQQLNNSTLSINNLTTMVDMYKTAWEIIKAENEPLKTQNINLTLLYNNENNKTDEMQMRLYYAEKEINSLNTTTSELRDNWCFSYTYKNQDYGPYINFPNILIGLIIGIITTGYLTKKFRIKRNKNAIHKNATTDIEKPRSHSLIHNIIRTDYGENKRQDIPYGTPKSFNKIDNQTIHQINTETKQNTDVNSEKIIETTNITQNPKNNILDIEDIIDNGNLKRNNNDKSIS